MTNQAPAHSDLNQSDALELGAGLIRWDSATIVDHSGPDALDLLHRLTTKELLSAGVGKAQRTVLTSDRGRVVDVFLVAHVADDRLLLISDSDNPQRTISAIDYYTIIEDAELIDFSESHTRLTLIGPRASKTVQAVLGIVPGPSTVHDFEADGSTVFVASDISRGVEWIDVVCPVDATDDLVAKFERSGAVLIEDESFEQFRISHGIPGSDHEYGEHANPIESGLLDLIDFDKGCYVGQEVIARLDAYDKVQRNLKVLESNSPLEQGSKLKSGKKPAGTVTSASSMETKAGNFVSLGLVRKAFAESGQIVESNGTNAIVR